MAAKTSTDHVEVSLVRSIENDDYIGDVTALDEYIVRSRNMDVNREIYVFWNRYTVWDHCIK